MSFTCNTIATNFPHFVTNNQVPKLTKHKRTFIETAFRVVPELKDFAKEGNRLAGQTVHWKKIREDFIHSSPEALDPVDGAYRFHRVETTGAELEAVYWDFKITAFPALAEELGALATDWQGFVTSLQAKYGTPQKR